MIAIFSALSVEGMIVSAFFNIAFSAFFLKRFGSSSIFMKERKNFEPLFMSLLYSFALSA